jgi:hypothetical protein
MSIAMMGVTYAQHMTSPLSTPVLDTDVGCFH